MRDADEREEASPCFYRRSVIYQLGLRSVHGVSWGRKALRTCWPCHSHVDTGLAIDSHDASPEIGICRCALHPWKAELLRLRLVHPACIGTTDGSAVHHFGYSPVRTDCA